MVLLSSRSLRPKLESLESRDTPASTFLDGTFGANGVVQLPGFTSVVDLLTLPDGGSFVLGTTADAGKTSDFIVERLTAAGVPDATFGTAGVATVAFDLVGAGQGDDVPVALEALADGGVVIVGTAATSTTQRDAAVARLTAAGTLDSTFGTGGKLTFSFTGDPTAFNTVDDLGIQPNGSLIVTGRSAAASATLDQTGGYAVRITGTGTIDPTYGTSGLVSFGLGTATSAVDLAGSLYALRADPAMSGDQQTKYFLNHFDATGQFVSAYGTAGRAEAFSTPVSNFEDQVKVNLLPLADGSLLATDFEITGLSEIRLTNLYRFGATGAQDTTFGTAGQARGIEGPTVVQGENGRLVGVQDGGGFQPKSAVAALTVGGATDTSFGANGVIDSSSFVNSPVRIGRPQINGTVLEAGMSRQQIGFALVRLLTTANQLPTVTPTPAAVTMTTTTTATVALAVADADSDPATLRVTAVGTNATLFPAGSITVSGTGATRTLTLTPAAAMTGSATVTVTVRDSLGAQTTVTIPVTVKPAPATLVGSPQFVVGPDAGTGPTVTAYNADGSVRRTLSVLDAGFTGGVRVAAADFTGDGIADLVVGTGPGSASRVEIYDGATFQLLFRVDPFEASFTGGVYVAAGDVTGDGVADLIVTPDEGGGPRVDVYTGAGFGKAASFFGIDDPAFRGGARAAVADLNGDGVGDLVVAAGFGGGPRVAGYDGPSVIAGTPRKLFNDFFAFEDTLRNGAFVAAGDVNGDGIADLVLGGGPGGGPRVLVLDGKALTGGNQQVALANFFAGDVTGRGGVRVAVKDLDNDNRADIVVGSGTGAGSHVTSYPGKTITAAGTPPTGLDFDAVAGFTGGVFVG